MNTVLWVEDLIVFAILWIAYSPWLIAERIEEARSSRQRISVS